LSDILPFFTHIRVPRKRTHDSTSTHKSALTRSLPPPLPCLAGGLDDDDMASVPSGAARHRDPGLRIELPSLFATKLDPLLPPSRGLSTGTTSLLLPSLSRDYSDSYFYPSCLCLTDDTLMLAPLDIQHTDAWLTF
jgi:hypothetical protein